MACRSYGGGAVTRCGSSGALVGGRGEACGVPGGIGYFGGGGETQVSLTGSGWRSERGGGVHVAGSGSAERKRGLEGEQEVAKSLESVVAIPIEPRYAKEGEIEACPHGEHSVPNLGKMAQRSGEERGRGNGREMVCPRPSRSWQR